jgi:hypothetical protein
MPSLDNELKITPNTQKLKNFWADTFALNTFCYLISIPIELGFAQMTFTTHLTARFIGLFIITGTARPFGIWRDFVFRKLKISASDTGIKPYIVDTLAYLSFELPLYMINMSMSGASLTQALRAALIFCVIAGVVGRPYGLYRAYIRRKIFNLD